MISKNEIKFIKSLNLQKFRDKNNVFKVEGWRTIKEFLSSDYKLIDLFVTSGFITNDPFLDSIPFRVIKQMDLHRISSFKTPNQTLAIFQKKKTDYKLSFLKENLVIALENISNPGNLGSIIRTADWFGVRNIVCSLKSVDVYNPKVIQASMGSLSRVSVSYTDFADFLLQLKKANVQTFGADLNGESFYGKKIQKGVIFFGKESSGLSKNTCSLVSQKIKIPTKNELCDSLNLSVSFGIIMSELNRT